MNDTLEQAVARAIARMAVDGITGWGLVAPSGWETVIVGEPIGCDSATCNHQTHSPMARTRKIYPHSGQLIRLGAPEGSEHIYYAHQAGATTFYRVGHPLHYHAWIDSVQPADVPEYLLAALAT